MYALHTVSGVMPSVMVSVYYYGIYLTASAPQLRVRLREAVEGALVLEGVTVAPSASPVHATEMSVDTNPSSEEHTPRMHRRWAMRE